MMKKKNENRTLIILLSAFLVLLAVTAVYVVKNLSASDDAGHTETVAEQTEDGTEESEEAVLGYEARETEAFVMPKGDAGDYDYQEPEKESAVDVGENGATKERMMDLAFDSAGCIVYAPENSSEIYRQGYISGTSDDNVNPLLDFAGSRKEGINSSGYVVWLFRNVFGMVGDELEDPISMYGGGLEIGTNSFEVGDIGFTSLDRDTAVYGVFVGYVNDAPVFTYLSPENGVSGLGYLMSAKEEYLGKIPPVDLCYFVRPDVPWRD